MKGHAVSHLLGYHQGQQCLVEVWCPTGTSYPSCAIGYPPLGRRCCGRRGESSDIGPYYSATGAMHEIQYFRPQSRFGFLGPDCALYTGTFYLSDILWIVRCPSVSGRSSISFFYVVKFESMTKFGRPTTGKPWKKNSRYLLIDRKTCPWNRSRVEFFMVQLVAPLIQ